MVAAITPLPVIGVPVRGSSLDGIDSLLSIVQVQFSLLSDLNVFDTYFLCPT